MTKIIREHCFQSWNEAQTSETIFKIAGEDYHLSQNEYETFLDEIPEEWHNDLIAGDQISCHVDNLGPEAGVLFWSNRSRYYKYGRWNSLPEFIRSFA